MNDITILINSCDLYESAWIPFFRLFQIQWPDCPYELVLNTETKLFDCSFMKIRTIPGGTVSWSKRLKTVLNQIDTEFIVYLLDDFFLMSPVNIESFNAAVDLIKRDKTVGFIGLKHNTHYDFKNGHEDNADKPFFSKDEVITVNRVNSMSALWRKDWLLSLLRNHETPWEFEIYGSVRSRRTNYKVLQINNYVMPSVFDYEIDYKHGYGISQKKWLPENKSLFEKYGIDVDFEELGWLELTHAAQKTQNSGDNRKSFRERLYNIKHYSRKIKKYVIKTERKIRSLI